MRFRLPQIVVLLLLAICWSGCGRGGDRDHLLGQKETVLKDRLFTMRRCLDEYTYDKKRAPQSLDDLVQAGYLKEIPKDPITGKADWQVDVEDPSHSTDPKQPGVGDVHSSSSLSATDGTAYNTW